MYTFISTIVDRIYVHEQCRRIDCITAINTFDDNRQAL